MIRIPGIFITILTFPGFVMETVARRVWCDLLGVLVYEAHYFKGTILHEKIESPLQAALVVFAPLSVNTVLCGILLFPVAFSLLLGSNVPGQEAAALGLLLLWTGVSIGMHALPTRTIFNAYLESLPEPMSHGNRSAYFSLHMIGGLFILIDFLKRFWLDLFYALAVGMATPWLITRLCIAL